MSSALPTIIRKNSHAPDIEISPLNNINGTNIKGDGALNRKATGLGDIKYTQQTTGSSSAGGLGRESIMPLNFLAPSGTRKLSFSVQEASEDEEMGREESFSKQKHAKATDQAMNYARSVEFKVRIDSLMQKLRVLVRAMINARKLEKISVLAKVNQIQGLAKQKPKTSNQESTKKDVRDQPEYHVERIRISNKGVMVPENSKLAVKIERPPFKLEDYTTNKGKAMVTSFVIEKVLSKSPDERTDVDLQSLDRLLMSIPYFRAYSRFPKVRKEIGRVFQYRCFEEGRTIVKQGHPCHNVYIILKGIIELTRHANTNASADPFLLEEDEKRRHGREIGLTDTEIYTGGNVKRDGSWSKTLGQGQLFGDLEIRAKVTRGATAKVSSDIVELLVISREDFERIVISFQDQLNGENYRILKTIPIINEIPDEDLITISHSCILKEYPADTVILRQNELHPECLFYMTSGYVKYSRAVPVVKKRQIDLLEKESSHFSHGYELSQFNYENGKSQDVNLAIMESMRRKSSLTSRDIPDDLMSQGSSLKEFLQQQTSRQRAILVDTGTACIGDIFGEESFFLYFRQMDRKTCLREHFRYPLNNTSLPDRMDILFNDAIRNRAYSEDHSHMLSLIRSNSNRASYQVPEIGSHTNARRKSSVAPGRRRSSVFPKISKNRRQSETTDQIKNLLKRKSFMKVTAELLEKSNYHTIASVPSHEKAKIKDPQHFYRRNMFNVTTTAVTTCLLIPKLKLLRYMREEHFDLLRKGSRSLLILGVMQQCGINSEDSTISSTSSLNLKKTTRRNIINLAPTNDTFLPPLIVPPSANRDVNQSSSISDNVNIWTIRHVSSDGVDPLESAIDKTIWKYYIKNWEWDKFKADYIRKGKVERETAKALRLEKNISQRYSVAKTK